MRNWFPRNSKGKAGKAVAGRAGLVEPSLDVFEQPEHGLLGEALRRPAGLAAAVLIGGAAAAFITNHYIFFMPRIDEFALLAFFVGGGLMLSTLLRTGDPYDALQKRSSASRQAALDEDLILEKPFRDPASIVKKRTQTGLAEAPAGNAPVAPGAMAGSKAVRPAPDQIDDEVSTFQEALVHFAKEGDLHGQGEVLRRLGHLAKSRGHLKESREFYMNSRSCFSKIDDHYAEAAVLLDLGQVLESLDEHDAASAAYRDANRALLDVAMNSGDRYNEIQAHAAD